MRLLGLFEREKKYLNCNAYLFKTLTKSLLRKNDLIKVLMAMVGDPCHAISRLSRSRSRRSQRLTTPAVIPNIDCDVVAKLDALIYRNGRRKGCLERHRPLFLLLNE
jgi:hypothetical protein